MLFYLSLSLCPRGVWQRQEFICRNALSQMGDPFPLPDRKRDVQGQPAWEELVFHFTLGHCDLSCRDISQDSDIFITVRAIRGETALLGLGPRREDLCLCSFVSQQLTVEK